MKNALEWTLDGLTFLSAATALGICLFLILRSQGPSFTVREDRVISDWQRYAVGHREGSSEAKVQMIVWADYECSPCRGFFHALKAVTADHRDEVSVIHRHWPLPTHRNAYSAARGAECAGEQGAFWGFHHRLFETENWLGDAFMEFATAAGVSDLEQFLDCLGEEAPVPVIERDIEAAQEMGATGTPTVVINGVHLGVVPLAPKELEALVSSALTLPPGSPFAWKRPPE